MDEDLTIRRWSVVSKRKSSPDEDTTILVVRSCVAEKLRQIDADNCSSGFWCIRVPNMVISIKIRQTKCTVGVDISLLATFVKLFPDFFVPTNAIVKLPSW